MSYGPIGYNFYQQQYMSPYKGVSGQPLAYPNAYQHMGTYQSTNGLFNNFPYPTPYPTPPQPQPIPVWPQPGWPPVPQPQDSLGTAFHIIDRGDSQPHNAHIDSHYSRWNNTFAPQSQQTQMALNNLYTEQPSIAIYPGKQHFEFNELGKYVAGQDQRISAQEFKALDIDGDNKISQAEYDAKKAEMSNNPPPQPGAALNTDKLLASIVSSDFDNNGQVSRQEIAHKAMQLEYQVNLYEQYGYNFPQLGEMKDTLKHLKLVRDNYNLFSDAGKAPDIDLQGYPIHPEHQINGQSLREIVTSANSDGTVADFSMADLSDLDGKVPRTLS